MSKVLNSIARLFGRRDNHTLYTGVGLYGYPIELTKHKFGETIYLNAVQLLTDIYSEVTWTTKALVGTPKFKAWRDFVDRNGQRLLVQLLREDLGYAVIGYKTITNAEGAFEWVFYQLPSTDYRVCVRENRTYIEVNDPDQLYFVLKSPTFDNTGTSDHELCKGYIAMLDAVMNGATTTAERLGAYVVMSPKTDDFGGVLNEDEKKDLEKQIENDYGMLKKQRQLMILGRPMDSQVVSLANADIRLNDKARLAILAIADRLKVPANQIAIIDANSSKSLSNGTELREGDMAKYRSFRRLLNATFWDFAHEIGLDVDYTIENEPKSIQGQTIETNV